jgi:hypothetical protein
MEYTFEPYIYRQIPISILLTLPGSAKSISPGFLPGFFHIVDA